MCTYIRILMTKSQSLFFLFLVGALVFVVFTSIGKKVASAAEGARSNFAAAPQ